MNKDNDILKDDMDERIESFLRGTMGIKEEIDFKKEIKSNPDLRNRALTMSSLIKELQAKESEKEQKVINSIAKSKNSKIRSILWWACSIAAVFAIFFGIYKEKERRYNILEAVVSPYYTQYDTENISRGEIDSVTVTHIYTLFNQIQEKKNVSSIIEGLELYRSRRGYYHIYHLFANDIRWNLALAYIKDDQIEKAIVLLEKLKEDNPDMPLSLKADELLKKIKDIQ